LQDNCKVESANLNNSMLGSHALLKGKAQELSLSDYSTID